MTSFLLPRWDARCTLKQHRHIQTELALMSCRKTDHADALLVEGLILNEEWAALCDFELNYTEHTAHSAMYVRQALAYFSKDASIDLGNKEARARSKFDAAEELCRETNQIFRGIASGSFSFRPCVEAVLFAATRKISRILGDVPTLEALKLHFGPGATTQVPRRKASARAKLGQRFACSEDLAPWASRVLEQMPSWLPWRDRLRDYGPLREQSDGNYNYVVTPKGEVSTIQVLQSEAGWDRVSDPDDPRFVEQWVEETVSVPVDIVDGELHFVPKTAKIFRTIIVEPSLNSMVQLGIGQFMAQRLRREGVDIRDQGPNQAYARLGSLDGSLATLDLSSASDTVATELVAALLPLEWFSFLSAFRSSHVRDGAGNRLSLQKFSSMGNGFTFPLETLLFYALAKAACEVIGDVGPCRAYGDDIIVPTAVVPLLTEVLVSCGFMLNRTKSFSAGPFRESCGKDYFSGIDIRPVYISVTEKPHRLCACDLFVLHNFFVRHGMYAESEFILEHLDPTIRIWGPDGYGDGHLVGDYVRNAGKHREHGFAGYTFETFAWKPVRSKDLYPGDAVLPSYSVYANPPRRGLADLDYDERNVRWETVGWWGGPRSDSVKWVKDAMWVDTPGRGKCHRIKIYILG